MRRRGDLKGNAGWSIDSFHPTERLVAAVEHNAGETLVVSSARMDQKFSKNNLSSIRVEVRRKHCGDTLRKTMLEWSSNSAPTWCSQLGDVTYWDSLLESRIIEVQQKIEPVLIRAELRQNQNRCSNGGHVIFAEFLLHSSRAYSQCVTGLTYSTPTDRQTDRHTERERERERERKREEWLGKWEWSGSW